MRQGHVKNTEDITMDKLQNAFKYSHSTRNLTTNDKVSSDLLYLLAHPDKYILHDMVPEYQEIIENMISGMEKAGTAQLAKEPPDNETSPPPSGYDESLFTRESLPLPRTQKFRKTPKEMEQYIQKTNQLNEQTKENAVKRDPAKAEQFRSEGGNEYKAKNFVKALSAYTQAVAHDPQNYIHYTNRAAAYISASIPQMAISDCERALLLDPTCIKAYVRLGNSLIDAGRPIEAIAMFEKAVQIDPRSNAKARLDEVLKCLYDYKFNEEPDDRLTQRVKEAKETELGKEIISHRNIEVVYSSIRYRHDLEDWIENQILVGPAFQ